MRIRMVVAVSAAILSAACAQQSIKQTIVATSVPTGQTLPDDPIALAQKLLTENNIVEAKNVLRDFVAKTPKDWRAITPLPNSVAISYWDLSEMSECSAKDAAYFGKQSVAWVRPSFSQGWYLLGFVALESKNPVEANQDIDRALALEPDQPTLLNEKATILQQMGMHEEALVYSKKVTQLGRCATTAARSRAWRSQGMSMLELGRLDEAEIALDESLKVDPGNPRTINELMYLEHLRGKNPTKWKMGDVQRVQ